MIALEQARLFDRRLPVELKFPGLLQSFDDTRDRFTVQVGALDLQRCIGRDLCGGQQVGLDQPHERGVADSAVLVGLREIEEVRIEVADHRRWNAVLAANRGDA